jgi:uncharacterized protein (DUF58 family)
MKFKRLQTFFRWFSRNRSIRLTSEGTRFLLFTLAVGVAAVNTGNNLFYLLLAMMLSLIVISGLLSEQCLRRLEFHRYLPDYLMANEPATVSLSIANRKLRLPSFSLRIMDVVDRKDLDRGLHLPHLPAQSSVLLSYPLLITRRGPYRLEGIRAVTPFPFGLFLKKALYEVEHTVLVGPEIRPLPVDLLPELAGDGQGRPLPRRGHGVDLYNLRLYQPGDDSRAIHWMTTARTSTLITKETAAEDQRQVTLVLSTIAPDSHDEQFERAVSLMASLAVFFQERGDAVRPIVGSEEISAETGPDALTNLFRTLALCRRCVPSNGGPVLTTLRSVTESGHQDEYVIAVLPWSDAHVLNACENANPILDLTTHPQLCHAAESSLSH